MELKPRMICYVGHLSCFFLELLSLAILILSNEAQCEQAVGLSHSVNITSAVFVILLDLVFASLILKCNVTVEIDPSVVIVNAWSCLVCAGAGVSIIFVMLYRCSGATDTVLFGGTLMIVSALIHLINAVYAYHKS